MHKMILFLFISHIFIVISDLIAGGSEERRRFMDVVISQYDRTYLDALVRYNKALQQRNTLLKAEEDAFLYARTLQ